MFERRVACFPQKNEALPRLSAALTSETGLEPCAEIGALMTAIRSGRIDATVVFVDAQTFDLAETALKRVRSGFAEHPLIAYYHPRGLSPRHLLRIAQTGITELVQFDVDDSRRTLARILNAAPRVSHVEMLASRLQDDVPEELRPLLVYALEHAGTDMQAPELAAAFGLSNRTLSWRMLQYNVPRPRMFLTWCRLLVAATLLNDKRRTLDSVSDQLNFPGGHSLGSVFYRYLHRGIISLREEGVLEAMLQAFRKELATGRTASLPARTRRG